MAWWKEIWNITTRAEWLERRKRNIGASDIAALFHAHKYTSAFQLWCLHTGRLPYEDADNAAMRRGRIFEPAVAEALREAHPQWDISPERVYIEVPALRIGCTPDFTGIQKDAPHGEPFLIQAKTVTPEVYEQEWTPAPPASHLLQAQAEMMITGFKRNLLAVMVLDGREFPVHEYMLQADEEIHHQIAGAAQKFWRHVEDDREPRLNHPNDAWAIQRLYPDAQAEPVLALHGQADIVRTCEAYHTLGKQIKVLEDERKALGSKLCGVLRNHAKAEAQDWVISWPTMPEQQRAATVVKAHRRLTVTRIKGAK